MAYKLLTYRLDHTEQAGILVADSIYPMERVTKNPQHRMLLGVLDDWPAVARILKSASLDLKATGELNVANAILCAPLPSPRTIYCAAANYSDHIANVSKRLGLPLENPREGGLLPYHFLKPSGACVVSPGQPIRYPGFAKELDWEVELVAVIGRKARHVTVADALSHVAGYTIANDLSVRDREFSSRMNVPLTSPFCTDFISMKGFDDSCPLGPYLVPSEFLGDPQILRMRCWVNGELTQDSSTAKMIFSVAEQVSYLSSRVTLLPGDIILTGTPAGTGLETGRFLSPGETIRVEIEGIGAMENQISEEETNERPR